MRPQNGKSRANEPEHRDPAPLPGEIPPPRDNDAERSVLGSMIRDNSCCEEVCGLVRVSDFAAAMHQRIFESITGLRAKRKGVDLVTLADDLHKRGWLADCGGHAYVGSLWEAAPTAANALHYAEIVRDRSLLREAGYVAGEILLEVAKPSQSAADFISGIEQKIYRLSSLGSSGECCTIGEAIADLFVRIDRRNESGGTICGVPSGLIDLDELTSGFQAGQLTIIGARPSIGKTALAVTIARHAASRGVPTFFQSAEQSRIELAERIALQAANVDSHKLRKSTLSAEDVNRMVLAGNEISSLPLLMDDAAGVSVVRLIANARRLQRSHGIKLVIVDYLQLIEPDDRRAPRHEQVSSVSRRLKQMARELDVPVIALAQVNRRSEERSEGRPKLSDLRESGGIEADADLVVLLHRPEAVEEPGRAKAANDGPVTVIEADVAKNRNGPTGIARLGFRKACMRFENMALATPFDRIPD